MTNLQRNVVSEIAIYLFILLFVYAAGSKLTEYETFIAQMAKSTILAKFSGILAVIVPVLELVTVLALALPKYRLLGLYMFLWLMSAFTCYIITILLFSVKLPCSCGGILSSLGWHEHLLFNIIFVALALITINCHQREEYKDTAKYSISGRNKKLVQLTVVLSGLVIICFLYLISDTPLAYKKGFDRKITKGVIQLMNKIEIGNGSYYLSGIVGGRFYFSNLENGSQLFSTDTSLRTIINGKFNINSEVDNFNFRNALIEIDAPFFYVKNGQSGKILKGTTGDWIAKLIADSIPYFLQSTIVGQDNMIFQSIANHKFNLKNRNILGKILLANAQVQWNGDLLVEQNGDFYTSFGILKYAKKINKLIYVYQFRNEVCIIDTSLNLLNTFHTIDTVTTAQVKSHEIGSDIHSTIAEDATVNKASAVDGNLLFINSGLMAQNETFSEFNNSSVIDVYQLNSGKYCGSFYLPDHNHKKIKSFSVLGNKILVTYDNQIALFRSDLNKIVKIKL